MKSYLGLVGEYQRIHKKKNRLTVLCIAISVCLVTAIFGMAEMAVRAQMIEQIKSNGNFHIIIWDLNDERAKLIGSRADVAVSGWVRQMEDGKLNGKPLEILGGDEAISGQMGLTLIEGRFPKGAQEALLDRRAMEQYSLKVGDTVSVNFADDSERQLIITGFYDDFSSLKKDDAHGLFLTAENTRALSQATSIKSVSAYYVQFKDLGNIRNSIQDIKQSFHLTDKQITENVALLGIIGQSDDNYMMTLYATAGVLVFLVLAAGILMIASSFNMSVLERIQFFGLLRCLGASQKQVKRFVLLEGLRLSLKGIPFGLFSGMLITWGASAFLKYVNAAFFSSMPLFGISWISLFTGVAVGLLTVILASLSPCRKAAKVSPLSAITGNINRTGLEQRKTALWLNRGRVEISMGMHHAFSGKKNMILMTASFAISIILFLSFSSMVDFMYQAVKPLKPYTPDLSIVSSNNTLSLDPGLLAQVKNNPSVKRAYGRMFSYDIPVSVGQEKGEINLISYEENQFAWAKEQLIEGSVDEAENSQDSVLVVHSGDLKWKVGDTLSLNVSGSEKKVKIAGILSSSPFDAENGKQTVICSEKAFAALTGGKNYTIIDIQLANTDDKAASQIRSLTTAEMKFSDRRQSNDEARVAFYSFAVFIYGFLFIIASITVFNIINSMNASMAGRLNQYGVMRAVGMSGRQLRRMVFSESASYAVCGCAVGCILGLPLNQVLYRAAITSHWGIPWQPPLVPLLLIVGLSVLTTLLSVIGPVRKISSLDIVGVVNAQ